MVVNNGKYPVDVTGQLIVYETADGALCVAVPLAIAETENNPAWDGKTTITLVKKDGTVMTKSWDNLKKCFAWDGQDPFWLMYENPEDEASAPRDFSALFETEKLSAVMEQEEFTPESGEPYIVSKVKFLNPPGGFANMPAPADRKSVLAKYASKFRALGGGSTSAPSAPQAAPKAPGKAPVAPGKTPGKTPAKAPPVATKPPSAPPAPPTAKKPAKTGLGGTAVTATIEEAWKAYCASMTETTIDEAQLGSGWYGVLKTENPGKQINEYTPAMFGAIKVKAEAGELVEIANAAIAEAAAQAE